ncbi:MAG: class I SAM-dependent methyltransferase [Micavibrio sp.]
MQFKKMNIDNGIVSVDPLPTPQELSAYYEEKYYQESDGKKSTYDSTYTPDELAYKRLESQMSLQGMLENLSTEKSSPTILDLGCGEGFLVKEAADMDYAVTGVDFSSFGVEKWNPDILGLCQFGDIYRFLDSCIKGGKKFDVCILRNVLEHVIDPSELLQKIRKILSVDGIALITVPNDYSALQALAMKKGYIDREFWFAPPDHLYYFNTKNITPFIEQNNFTVKDMFSSFPIDFFLFHRGSNYIADRENGKEAHFARITIDLLLAEQGMKKFLSLYRSMADCGIGRDFTVVIRSS